MRLVVLLSFFLTACSTMSDYERGCRDGIMAHYTPPPQVKSLGEKERESFKRAGEFYSDYECTKLERKRQEESRNRRLDSGHFKSR